MSANEVKPLNVLTPRPPRRLTLVIHSLSGGGAERTVAEMANHWACSGDAVSVVTLDSQQDEDYPLIDQVQRIALGAMKNSRFPLQALAANLRRIRLLRQAVRKSCPDIVVSFTDKTNVLTVAACRKLRVPLVVAERTVPWRHPLGRVWKKLWLWSYRRATAIVAQTGGVAGYLQQILPEARVFIIENCVWPNCFSAVLEASKAASEDTDQQEPLRKPWIVGIGRLSHEKGFDLLIQAFGRIADRYPQWELKILGEGEQRGRLEELIEHHGLRDQAELCGWRADPHAVLRQAELFVLSSRYEGFPNSLLEAMACGAAAISFDCEVGPRNIIRAEVDGVLVPAGNVKALSRAMAELIDDEERRRQLRRQARERVEHFSVKRFFKRWEEVLDSCSKA